MRVLALGEESKNKVLLHKYDQKILSLLCLNARLPISKIASLLKLSRQSIEYRLSIMKKHNLIVGSRAVINIGKLGFQSYHYFLTINSEDQEKKFIEKCIANHSVNALISYSGKWNYELSIMAKSPIEADMKFIELLEGTSMVDYSPTILLKNLKSGVLPENECEKLPAIKNIKNDPSFSKQFTLTHSDYLPDGKDKVLLYLLSQDAQLTLSALGSKLHLSRDSISYRIKKLIRGGFIVEFRPVINYESLGLSVQTVLLKAIRSKSEDTRFKYFIKKQGHVLWATEVFGTYDYIIYLLNNSQEEIHSFISNLRSNFPAYLQSYEILFAYKEHKYGFMTESMREN